MERVFYFILGFLIFSSCNPTKTTPPPTPVGCCINIQPFSYHCMPSQPETPGSLVSIGYGDVKSKVLEQSNNTKLFFQTCLYRPPYLNSQGQSISTNPPTITLKNGTISIGTQNLDNNSFNNFLEFEVPQVESYEFTSVYGIWSSLS